MYSPALNIDLNRRYTFADYLTWVDDTRRELVNGIVKLMSPAPSRAHQDISRELVLSLANKIKRYRGRCKVYYAPFDVRLPQHGTTADDQIYTVVQPDICVVCDLSKLDEHGCLGAPDLVVEVQSVATAKYDLDEKFHIYQEAGVKEYWVVVPAEGLLAFILQPDGSYAKGVVYHKTDKLPIHIFDGVELDLTRVFQA
ncbi:MAG: Uma2 family endonuclease [Prevotellaceae bacterium]|jgi:Uma2 family endonuclease|nr:Uma2 family endonuclease [Prevotellaceae bacterium]